MTDIAAAEGYPAEGHRSVTVLRLAEVIEGDIPISPAFDRLTSTEQSRKGGSILAGLAAAVRTGPARADGTGTACGLLHRRGSSANLAQLGSLAAPVAAGDKVAGALGQRYGIEGAVLVRADGPVTEPHSTGDKPDKIIILFRHFVRAAAHPAPGPCARHPGRLQGLRRGCARPGHPADDVLQRDLRRRAAHPSRPALRTTGPGRRADRLHRGLRRDELPLRRPRAAPPGDGSTRSWSSTTGSSRRSPRSRGEAADLLTLIRTLDLDDYVTLIEHLRAEDHDDPRLFDRRWPVQHLRDILRH